MMLDTKVCVQRFHKLYFTKVRGCVEAHVVLSVRCFLLKI